MEKRNLDMERIKAKLTQGNARLSEMRNKAATETQADMKLEDKRQSGRRCGKSFHRRILF